MPPALQKLEAEEEACYSEIGTIAWNMGDHEKALRNLEEALRRSPFCVQALQGMARYWKDKENHTKVVEFASRSLALDESGAEGEMWSLIGALGWHLVWGILLQDLADARLFLLLRENYRSLTPSPRPTQ